MTNQTYNLPSLIDKITYPMVKFLFGGPICPNKECQNGCKLLVFLGIV
jgi:hypothetical protein